ncbi:MAG: hypothetical protein KBC27_03815 [Rickettsiales bacterium]|nr:hypothetical protein [Rickettsiales bacterium]
MPEYSDNPAEQFLLIHEAFSEMIKLAATVPSALPVFVNGLVLGISKFAHDNLAEKIPETKDLIEIERYAELQQENMFSERFNENKQRFIRVCQVQKDLLMKQWQAVTEKDIKSLILANKIKDNNLMSHIIRQRVANNDFEEQKLMQITSVLALTDTLRLFSNTAVAGTLSGVSEYSECIGYCFAEKMHMLSPAALKVIVSCTTELQQLVFVSQVENNVQKLGRKVSGAIVNQVQALAALASFPLSILKHTIAGAYDGLHSVDIPEAKKSKDVLNIEEIIKKIEQSKSEELEYQKKSRVGQLLHSLQSARKKMYDVSQENIGQLKEDWNRAYSVALAKYDKADREVVNSMAKLLEKNPNRASRDDQFELVFRHSSSLEERRLVEENLTTLMSKKEKTQEDIENIDVCNKLLRLDKLRQSTDSEAKKQVTELERELKGKKTIEPKLGYYDIARATITASSLFVKAEVYAASKTIASTTMSAIGSLANNLCKKAQDVTRVYKKNDIAVPVLSKHTVRQVRACQHKARRGI